MLVSTKTKVTHDASVGVGVGLAVGAGVGLEVGAGVGEAADMGASLQAARSRAISR
jgi:hypothetical protein